MTNTPGQAGAAQHPFGAPRPLQAYPREAINWLLPGRRARMLEIGTGSGRLAQQLASGGHLAIASDSSPRMSRHLRGPVADLPALISTTTAMPLASASLDLVVAAHPAEGALSESTMREVFRVLRPRGTFACVWSSRDESVPWVKRLAAILGSEQKAEDPEEELTASGLFAEPERKRFRHWQSVGKDTLVSLARARSHVSVRSDVARADAVRQIGELYDEYGRGPDGMRLPYACECFRVRARHGGFAETQRP